MNATPTFPPSARLSKTNRDVTGRETVTGGV